MHVANEEQERLIGDERFRRSIATQIQDGGGGGFGAALGHFDECLVNDVVQGDARLARHSTQIGRAG